MKPIEPKALAPPREETKGKAKAKEKEKKWKAAADKVGSWRDKRLEKKSQKTDKKLEKTIKIKEKTEKKLSQHRPVVSERLNHPIRAWSAPFLGLYKLGHTGVKQYDKALHQAVAGSYEEVTGLQTAHKGFRKVERKFIQSLAWLKSRVVDRHEWRERRLKNKAERKTVKEAKLEYKQEKLKFKKEKREGTLSKEELSEKKFKLKEKKQERNEKIGSYLSPQEGNVNLKYRREFDKKQRLLGRFSARQRRRTSILQKARLGYRIKRTVRVWVYKLIALGLMILLLIYLLVSCMSSSSSTIAAGSYWMDDNSMIHLEQTFSRLEQNLYDSLLRERASGYDSLVWDVDVIGHNPYDLMAYLNSTNENDEAGWYTLEHIEPQALFQRMYSLSIEREVYFETVLKRTFNKAHNEWIEVKEEVARTRLIVRLRRNGNIEDILKAQHSQRQKILDQFQILQETKGGKPELFGGVEWVSPVLSTVLWNDTQGRYEVQPLWEGGAMLLDANAQIPAYDPSVRMADNSALPGQCTWFVKEYIHQLTGISYGPLGHAKDWAKNLQNSGKQVDTHFTAGSIVCYPPNYRGDIVTGEYGHVGIVTSQVGEYVTIQEMNVKGIGQISQRTVRIDDLKRGAVAIHP